MKGRRGGRGGRRRGQGMGRGALTSHDTEVTRGRGGGRGGRRRGQGMGRGALTSHDTEVTRGRGGGRGRGRGRGARVLAKRLNVLQRGRGSRGRGRGEPARQEGRGGAIRRGRGRGGTVATGGRGVNRGNPDIRTRLGRGSTRGGRGRGVQVRRGRGLFRGRPVIQDQQVYQEAGGWDPSFRQRVAQHKVQQARITLASRKQTRFNMLSARRGINNEVKTRSNMGVPLRVRVGRGTVVQGMRSDQLLLHKMKQGSQHHNTAQPYTPAFTPRSGVSEERKAGSMVSLSSNHGLTVSIRNNIASGSLSRNRPHLNRNRLKPEPAASHFAPTMFTVVNDRAYSPEPQPAPPPQAFPPSPPKRPIKRNIVSERDPRSRVAQSMMVVPTESVRPVPEPHRQILDPKVQKEIAMLQGKGEVSLNNGPGPGVKGFRHVPSQTTRSLNERFTEERMVTA